MGLKARKWRREKVRDMRGKVERVECGGAFGRKKRIHGGIPGFRFAKQRTTRKTKKVEERVSGWFIESLRGSWIAEEGAQAEEGRLYSFQTQKLNLISNINLFSLCPVPLLLLRSLSSSSIRRCCAPFLSYTVHSGARLTLYPPGYE